MAETLMLRPLRRWRRINLAVAGVMIAIGIGYLIGAFVGSDDFALTLATGIFIVLIGVALGWDLQSACVVATGDAVTSRHSVVRRVVPVGEVERVAIRRYRGRQPIGGLAVVCIVPVSGRVVQTPLRNNPTSKARPWLEEQATALAERLHRPWANELRYR